MGGPVHRTCSMQSAYNLRGRSLHLHDFMAVISLEMYNMASLLPDPSWTATEKNCNVVRVARETIRHLTRTQHAHARARTRLAFKRRQTGKHCTFNSHRIKDEQVESPLCLQYRRLSASTTHLRLISNPDRIPRE